MKPSPVLSGLRTYPFVRLTEAKRRLVERGVPVIDFGVGEPREDTPPFIREALAAAVTPQSTYPLAEGLPELREAVADWVERRFGPRLDPAAEVLPTLGSKEAIFHLAQVVGGDLVAVTAPGYPVAERGAAFAGKDVIELPLAAERGFLPDLDAVDAATWERTGILWLNYPNNPTAATAPLDPARDRGAQLGQPLGERVRRLGVERRDECIADEGRRVLARLAHPEVDHRHAAGEQLPLGVREPHERIRAQAGEHGGELHPSTSAAKRSSTR